MTNSELTSLAIREGFDNAAVIDTNDIVFDAVFRVYCEENKCGQYGFNYSCPPHCGTAEQMKQKVLSHKKALVLQTISELSDLSNLDDYLIINKRHNNLTIKLIKQLESNGHCGFMIGAGSCQLCKTCSILKNEPCVFPDKQYSCIAAYCIHVKNLAEKCNITYDYQNGMLPLFSVYVFD